MLSVLGYQSERVPPEQSGDVGEFIDTYPAENPNTKSEQLFRKNVKSVHILFQMTDSEIGAVGEQDALFMGEGFDKGNAKSFMFATVQTGGGVGISRGTYANIAREINKRFSMPTVVLFKTLSNFLSLAFVQRRPHKRAPNRDVLGRVSLIREINTQETHRAHLDILTDLMLCKRLQWINTKGKKQNFDGLLDAWLDALDTEELNQKFYRQLFTWFERAVEEAKFPTQEKHTLAPQEHVIRLITRLLFIWFIKEKGLVAPKLFEEEQIKHYLKKYDRNHGDSYYRVVLQNLFFATLNTQIEKRNFSKSDRVTHRDFLRYRYRDEIADVDGLLNLFSKTPFINGGLFECLDSFENYTAGGYRIDCFTDNVNDPTKREYNMVSVPNCLFFDDDGLITLFERYKFTIEESTPVEQEVALDPELLGKVFENLLASYNPETNKTARRSTGSYYTPTTVVNYMVDEALIESLAEKVRYFDDNGDGCRERLRYLFDYEYVYDDTEDIFESTEKCDLVKAISEIKVIDPAVGSGAFPIGILHKLTLALSRLDPYNIIWQKIQKERSLQRVEITFDTEDVDERESELSEINEIFEVYRDSNYGRKLYLIQNSIFGVDIQPIACQIAKLRFFISLVIEQIPTSNIHKNYDIKPLPNLETKFVAADTLMMLDRPIQGEFQSPEVEYIKRVIVNNRELYFHASTRDEKWRVRKQDKSLRNRLANALRKSGFPDLTAEKIAEWNPYDQNTHAKWFDAEYMFYVKEGFDIVIGNPPYCQVKKGIYSALQFPYSEGKDSGKQNLYKLFVEQSYNLCKENGIATLIVQSSLMCDQSSAYTRQLLLNNTNLKHIIEFPERAKTRDAQVFSSVTQGTCIYQFTKSLEGVNINISTGNDTYTINSLLFSTIERKTVIKLYPSLYCFPLIKPGTVSILRKVAENQSIKPLKDFVVDIVQGDLNLTTSSEKFSSKYSPVRLLRGSHISRYHIDYGATTEFCDEDFLQKKVDLNRESNYLLSKQVMNSVASRRLAFALSDRPPFDFLAGNTINKLLLQNKGYNKILLSILNSKFMDWFFRITSTNNHIQGYQLKQLPIPEVSRTDCKQLETLVDLIMQSKNVKLAYNTDDEERKIDMIVYRLYELTEEEIAIVEGE